MTRASSCLFTSLLLAALACDPHGVSLGHEELCRADPRLVASELIAAEPLSPCATIGDNALSNAGFETPVVGPCSNGLFCQFAAVDVDGWETDDVSQVIEIWNDGHLDVPSYEGAQFVELDADSPAAVWQDVALEPGSLMYWSLVHRGRDTAETFELLVGPPEATTSQGLFESPVDAWYFYSGLYRVGASETLTRLSLVSRSGTTKGNLLDAIFFAPVDER